MRGLSIRVIKLFAVAAGLTLIVGMATWLFFTPRQDTAATAGSQDRQPSAGALPSPASRQAIQIEVELRKYVRTSSQQPVQSEPFVRPRRRLHATIVLPREFGAGTYEIHVMDSQRRSIVAASASADVRDAISTVRTTLDTSEMTPATYYFGIRGKDQEWHRFPAVVK
jgi:hypothetical protein